MNSRIKQIREIEKLSQRAFADRIGISGPSVARLESGENNPGEQTIRAICREFGVRREWLELGHEPMYAKEAASEPEALVPDLMAILADRPAILETMRRIIGFMAPADWDRLNALLDAVADTKKDPEA